MSGCDPSAVRRRFVRRRGARETDLRGYGEFGGGLVPELADRAVLIDRVILVTDDLGDRGPRQGQRQDDDPGAPSGAASQETRGCGSSFCHPFSTLAEIGRGGKGEELDSGSPFLLE